MTDAPGPSASVVPAPLVAYAGGLVTSAVAVAALGVRDYADLLVALGDAGLTPPRPPAHVVDEEATTFEALWTGGQDDGTEVRDLTDEELALIMAVQVPDGPGDVRELTRPYTTDRIHVLRGLPRVRRPEGFETD